MCQALLRTFAITTISHQCLFSRNPDLCTELTLYCSSSHCRTLNRHCVLTLYKYESLRPVGRLLSTRTGRTYKNNCRRILSSTLYVVISNCSKVITMWICLRYDHNNYYFVVVNADDIVVLLLARRRPQGLVIIGVCLSVRTVFVRKISQERVHGSPPNLVGGSRG